MSSKKITLKDVGGCFEIKKQLEMIAEARKLDNNQTPRMLYFYGIPGTGKSLTAKAFANECGLEFNHIDLGYTFSLWYGEGEQNLKKELDQEGVIILDEFERISQYNSTNLLNIIAEEIDNYKANKKGIFIATSNNLEINPKFKKTGRFDMFFNFKEPDYPEIADIFSRRLRDMQKQAEVQPYNGVNVSTIAKAIYRISRPESPIVGSDIVEIVRRTHEKKWNQYMKTGVFDKIKTDDFLKTVQEYNKV